MLKLITLPLRILLDAWEVVKINRAGARFIAEHPYDPQERDETAYLLRTGNKERLEQSVQQLKQGSALYRKF